MRWSLLRAFNVGFYILSTLTMFLMPLGLFLIFALSMYIVTKLLAKRDKDLEAEMQEQENTRFQELEAGILEWIDLLQLPTLESQKKREEAARLLSIVLVERLMLRRVRCCRPNMSQR